MTPIYGNCVGGTGLERTYILVDDDGNEYAATFVDNDTSLDATPNDIRQGKMAATDDGVVTGEKVIPSYHTSEGAKLITAGEEFKITGLKRYDYTKLQALICLYNTSMTKSVSTEKVVIDNHVYSVLSTDSLATVTIDHDNMTIDLGITNEETASRVMRYFTFKEEY